MARPGRKSKPGYREPNGRPQRPTTAARLNELNARMGEQEQSVVLMQPHRGGRVPSTSLVRTVIRNVGDNGRITETVVNDGRHIAIKGTASVQAESPLGRLCLRNKLRKEMFDAGQSYAAVVSCWRSAKGIPASAGRNAGGSGLELSDADVRRWRDQMMALERAVMRIGIEALLALRTLVLDEAEPGVERDEILILALHAVAVENGTMKQHSEPFAS